LQLERRSLDSHVYSEVMSIATATSPHFMFILRDGLMWQQKYQMLQARPCWSPRVLKSVLLV